MKVCFITGAFPNMKCGIGDYTAKLAETMADKGIDIYIVTSINANNNKEKIKIYNRIRQWNFKNLKTIIKILQEIKPDVVHIQYPSNEYKKNFMINLLPFIIRKKIKCKVVSTLHEYSIYTIFGKIRNLINVIFSDYVVVVEKQYKKLLKKYKNEKYIKHIPISSNIPPSIISIDEINKIKKEYNLQNKKVISYFGFITPTKGIEFLLKSLKEINNEQIVLLLIGELNENNVYHKKILNLINEYGLNKKIIITGFIKNEKDVANCLKISDVCVLPFIDGVQSRNGSFLAAYNQNVKIITTSNIQRTDNNGIYYINNKKLDMLTEKIVDVININEKVDRKVIGWEEIGKKHIELYKNIKGDIK